MHDNGNTTRPDQTVISAVQSWGWSPEQGFAFEQDMAAENDYEQWIAEMEAEAGDASKQTADLSVITEK
jgi:hypothetical protein